MTRAAGAGNDPAADEPPTIARQDLFDDVLVGRVTPVEALGPDYYADAHLPGAVNLTPGLVSSQAASLLPDRDAEIVVYGSATSPNSLSVARLLRSLGYARVRHYPAGKEDWVEHGLPVERT
jgi:rhodanese-related sulfurtransferase